MDTKKVDVMVADASHEVYVDKILDTIREAAKVRGTGIAERTHEYQNGIFPPGTLAMAQRQSIQSHQRSRRHENEYGIGIRSRHFQ